MKKLLMCVAAAGIMLAPAMIGQEVVKGRASNQKARVKEGVASGELTKHEARSIAKDERKIKRETKAAAADGTVTAAEKAKITKDQTKVSKKIARDKHNDRTRQ